MDSVYDGLLGRIVRDGGVPDLVEILADRLTPTDLQSLMMEVYRRRAARLTPPQLLERFAGDRFSRPASIDPRAVSDFEQLAWSVLPEGYEAVELSPVCPLGTNSVIATVDQHKVVSTSRNGEVVADSTAVLALACALRRRSLLLDRTTRWEAVRLVSSQRQTRAQAIRDPRSTAHFRLLAVVSAGRDRGSRSFETEALATQIGFLVDVIHRYRPALGIRVALTDLGAGSGVWERDVARVLTDRFPLVGVGFDPTRQSGRGYYVDACYKIFVVDPAGEEVEVADGGCTTWTRQLLSSDKERLVIGGLGSERLLGTQTLK